MKTNLFLAAIIFAVGASAQPLKSTSPGDNRKAMVGETIGITKVTINYDRPGVKGREGKIYGTPIVHTGFQDLNFGTSKAAPWRAGANENTTIEFSTDVKIEDKELPAGKYGFFIAFDPNECTLIFSKNSTSWGSFYYDEKEDVLRVKVKPVARERSVEWLKYEFTAQTENSATIDLQWEKLSIPFKVEVDLFETMLKDYRLALRGGDGFSWEANEQAAALCLKYNKNYEEGLKWSNTALNMMKNFSTLSTSAGLLEKSGNKQRSDSMMKEALAVGNVFELHFYARRLLKEKKTKDALEVFTLNAKKHPKEFTPLVGLARGYSANGNYKLALANAKQALPLAPNELNKQNVKGMIEKLEKGTDIN